MTWVRRDDQASIHRKVAPLDDATYRLWSEAIEWCSRNLTDGVIRADELADASKRGTKPRAAKLVERLLWHTAGTLCESPKCPPAGKDGWVIHDYFDYQPSREKVRMEQMAKADRQKKWVEAHKRRNNDASGDASHPPSRDALEDVPPSPSPSPPRPEGRGGTTSLQRTPAAAGDGGAPGGEIKTDRPSRICPTCGNHTDSAYHRNNCRRSAA